MSREDGNQDIQTVQLRMPPGLSGILAGIPLCPEAQANAGTCSPTSEIGKTIVSVGLGGDPFTVTGGQVFLTQGYKGVAPFGLSIVNPAKAGPFDLGKVIVRAKIEVDPHTAVLTVTTDQIPHILDGIPLQIKHVNVTIDRPGFTFNPTNCNGVSTGEEAPSTLVEPNEPFGSQANIAKVKVELPKQLPSRLTTLQKACTNAQFEANPAGCPAGFDIGHSSAKRALRARRSRPFPMSPSTRSS